MYILRFKYQTGRGLTLGLPTGWTEDASNSVSNESFRKFAPQAWHARFS